MPLFAVRLSLVLLVLLFAVLLVHPVRAAENHIQAELVANGTAAPGQTAELALHFRPAEGWHGYWTNPGDAGYGMTLDWDLPQGWTAGDPDYPVPHTLKIGSLMNHVYEGDYAVLVPLRVPFDAQAGKPVILSVDAQWLACTDTICVPEQAVLSVVLTPGAGLADDRFDAWRAAIPAMLDRPARFGLNEGKVRIAIPLPAALRLADPHVFVETTELVDYAAQQHFMRKGDWLVAELSRKGTLEPSAVTGILRLDDAGNGVRFEASPGAVPKGGTPVAMGPDAGGPSLWILLAGALAGGLLLNVMPCVFPILSLKALSLARAGESEAEARREGVAYTAGVVLACLALGTLLLVLRAGGEQVGWAFQLQEPGVVIGLLLLAVAVTANLAGLFELPSLSITRDGKPGGAFATGLLAAFVATPCTGPFMAAAMGAALLLPIPQALLLFATLGLGLALPFLALGWVPALRAMLPRPGNWMVRFRHILAVPMGLTALALLWLTSRLGGVGFALAAGLTTSGLLIALWVLGRRQRQGRAGLAPFATIAAPFALFAVVALPASFAAPSAADAGLLAPRVFSDTALNEARASGKPVFLWFTADWCVTCKVNESIAIDREATKKAFGQAGVIAMRGDWTRRDPAITHFLTENGAAGVPLYLWYPANGDAQKLPQVLGPESLVTLADRSRGGGTN
ncbi:protein-disulfide reductase DsbD family protein [Croceicoccus estronivorus]|uniref:protein-disulfide reductase DsbD family protein n=1 Tax=Croceicoccus estronivorus TaxID=1172626 RepID=UPI0009EE70CE|nr:protein-disulfide reductase DsbD domain-containing protein [Croceicoccus estronivorus]